MKSVIGIFFFLFFLFWIFVSPSYTQLGMTYDNHAPNCIFVAGLLHSFYVYYTIKSIATPRSD